jgi:nucleotide-binding universal stress UspA family protein
MAPAMRIRSILPGRKTALVVAGVAAALVLAYAAAGAWLLPWLVKRELPAAAEKWSARARVADIDVNPFTLQVRVTGLALEEKSGKPLLAAREVHADLEWRSLARRVLVLAELRIVEPRARVEISEKGQLNFASLTPPPREPGSRPGPPPVDLGNVTVEGGVIDFEDRSEGYKNRFERLSLKLSSISTVKGAKGPYDLAAHTPDGTQLRWKGEVSIEPLTLSGVLMLEQSALAQLNPYLSKRSEARITSGRAHIELPHRFALRAGEPQLEVKGAKLVVEELALVTADAARPFATVARLALEGIEADLLARRASAQALRVAGFSLAAKRDARGELHPQRLLPALRAGAQEASWQFSIAEVDLSGGAASLADEGIGTTIELDAVSMKLAPVSSDTKRELAFEVAAGVGSGGRLAARGKAVPADEAAQARIEVSGIPIALLQSVLGRHADVRIASGQFAAAGDLSVGAGTKTRRGRSANLVYSGSAALENVALRDAAGAPLVEWKALSTKSLNLTLAPNLARIDDLRWMAPKGRLEIARDGTTNIGRLFPGNREGARPAATESKPAPAPPAPEVRPEPPTGAESGAEGDRPDETGQFPVRIRRMQVDGGTLDFTDQSLNPNFNAVIQELTGTVNGLSTDRNTRSQIALEGRVGEFGYARISGTLNPFAPRERTAFRVQFRNLDLASISPYTVKFAGYRVATGRLTLDLNYRVRANRLEGDNHVLLDDFTLGERVGDGNSPGLPLELAVSLLKDENGRIDLAVPISGSLDDPEFKLGDVFWKALGTILGNIVTAPFRALGRLFGGNSEQLAVIAFEPGDSRLLPPEREKFPRIAEGLAKRPELKLVVPARYDAQADPRALKREALRRELAQRAGFDVGADDPAGPVSLEDRRTRRALRELYAQRFGDAELGRAKEDAEREAGAGGGKAPDITVGDRIRNFASGEPQVADPGSFYRGLYRRLADAQPIAEGALVELAQKRAAAVTAGLQAAGIPAERVTQSSAEPSSSADAKQVTLQLTLAPAR